MMKLYGVAASRAMRCLWMLEELGVEYEHVPINFSDECKTPEYLKLNPNGHVPTLVDGDTVLWESMAINLYLVQKYGGPLQPKSVEEFGHTVKWSFWGMTEVEKPLLELLFHRAIFPEGQRDRAVAERAWKELQKPLGILDDALGGREFLVGESFCAGDLNLASILAWLQLARADLDGVPNAQRWLTASLSRPALKRARERR
jgi:glutathione S-transferase